jgi:hypothetical protein
MESGLNIRGRNSLMLKLEKSSEYVILNTIEIDFLCSKPTP